MHQVVYYDKDGEQLYFPATRDFYLAQVRLSQAIRKGYENARLRTL